MLVAKLLLALVWIVCTCACYFAVLLALQAQRGYRLGLCGLPPEEPPPSYHMVALVVTMIWCAITANLPL